jgi:hypothetical protein
VLLGGGGVVVVMIAVGVFLLDPFVRALFNLDLRFKLKLLLDFLNGFLSLKRGAVVAETSLFLDTLPNEAIPTRG